MNWTQLSIKCSINDLEKVKAIMSVLEDRLVIEDYSDLRENSAEFYGGLIDESLLEKDTDVAKVSFYLDETKDPGDALAFLTSRFNAEGIGFSSELVRIGDDDWANEWKKYYKPVKPGEKIVIVPAWQSYKKKDGEEIVLMDPGAAFGSGTHESTKLCLRLLERYMPKDSSMLDIGTGSGILSVSAMRLGAKRVIACDLDPQCVISAKENIALNSLGDKIEVRKSDLCAEIKDEDGPFDFITENIIAEIVRRAAPDIARLLKTGASVAVSGVLDSEKKDVIAEYEKNGLGLADIITDGDWVGLLFTKLPE